MDGNPSCARPVFVHPMPGHATIRNRSQSARSPPLATSGTPLAPLEFETAAVKKKVLFVDDEQSVLDGLRRILRTHRDQWEMSFAASVDEALEMLWHDDFDSIISDINMPGRDGFDLLQAVRGNPDTADIPVVILTGNGEKSLKRKSLDMGATDLLNKPADPDELVARINSVLRLKSYQDEIKVYSDHLEQMVRQRTAELEYSRVELIWRLGRAGEFHDSDTGQHVIRVAYYALTIALAMGLNEKDARRIFLASPLHDLGKIGIPDNILLKPGPLTPDEWEVMKTHTKIGAEILRYGFWSPTSNGTSSAQEMLGMLEQLGMHVPSTVELSPVCEMAAQIAESHHERWDGTGYPQGLKGEEIPLGARVTALADVFDALVSNRPYKNAMSEEEALEIIQRGVGTHFDPEVFEAFMISIDTIRQVREDFPDVGDAKPQFDMVPSLTDLRAA